MRTLIVFLLYLLCSATIHAQSNSSSIIQTLRKGSFSDFKKQIISATDLEEVLWKSSNQLKKEFANSSNVDRSTFKKDFESKKVYQQFMQDFEKKMTAFYAELALKNAEWKLIQSITANEFLPVLSKDSLMANQFLVDMYSVNKEGKHYRVEVLYFLKNDKKYFFEPKFKAMSTLSEENLYEFFIENLSLGADGDFMILVNLQDKDRKLNRELMMDTRNFTFLKSNYSRLPEDKKKLKEMFPDRSIAVDSTLFEQLIKKFGHPPFAELDELNFKFSAYKNNDDLVKALNQGKLKLYKNEKAAIYMWAHRLFLQGIRCTEVEFQLEEPYFEMAFPLNLSTY